MVVAAFALSVCGWAGAMSGAAASTAPPENSTHQAGYVVTGLSLHTLTAGWTEPTVSCSGGSSYARILVGLSSPRDRLVVGTSADCVNGKPVAKLVGNVFGPRAISGGDHLTLTMSYYRGSYDVEIDNDTAGWGQGVAVDATGGPRMIHANFGVHSTTSSGRSLPLTDFGKAAFDHCTVGHDSLVDRHPQRMRMVTGEGTVRAVAGPLDATGGFMVTWKHR